MYLLWHSQSKLNNNVETLDPHNVHTVKVGSSPGSMMLCSICPPIYRYPSLSISSRCLSRLRRSKTIQHRHDLGRSERKCDPRTRSDVRHPRARWSTSQQRFPLRAQITMIIKAVRGIERISINLSSIQAMRMDPNV
jgi:hypothetical protein